MQQFTVPQFIDVEDKIIGPVTTRQFVIMLVAGLLIFILYKLLTFWFFVFFGVLIFVVSSVIAFVRINGQPFHFFMLNILQTWRSPKLQIWDKTVPDEVLREQLKTPPPPQRQITPRKGIVTTSRLTEITLIVDTGGVYTPEA